MFYLPIPGPFDNEANVIIKNKTENQILCNQSIFRMIISFYKNKAPVIIT